MRKLAFITIVFVLLAGLFIFGSRSTVLAQDPGLTPIEELGKAMFFDTGPFSERHPVMRSLPRGRSRLYRPGCADQCKWCSLSGGVAQSLWEPKTTRFGVCRRQPVAPLQ